MVDKIDMRDGPIGRLFRNYDASPRSHKIQAIAAVFLTFSPRDRMLRFVAFIGRDDGKDVEISPA